MSEKGPTREGGPIKGAKGVALAGVVGILAAQLGACASKPSSPDKDPTTLPTDVPTILYDPTLESKPTELPTLATETPVETEVSPQSIELNDVLTGDIEPKELVDPYVVTVNPETLMFGIPLTEEGFIENDKKVVNVQSDGDFKIDEVFELTDTETGEKKEIGVVSHPYSGNHMIVVVMNSTDAEGNLTDFVTKNETAENSISYLSSDIEESTDKVKNMLSILANVAEYQDTNGSLGIDDLEDLYKYLMDLDNIVIDENIEGSLDIDAELLAWKESADLVIDMLTNVLGDTEGYLDIRVTLSRNNATDEPQGEYMVITFSLGQEGFVGQGDDLLALFDSYMNTTPLPYQGDGVGMTDEEVDKIRKIYSNDPENIEFFTENAQEGDMVLEILKVQKIFEGYDESSDKTFVEYLTELVDGNIQDSEKLLIEKILEFFSLHPEVDETLEGTGFVMLLGDLFPELPIPYLGEEVMSVREMFPEEIIKVLIKPLGLEHKHKTLSDLMENIVFMTGFIETNFFRVEFLPIPVQSLMNDQPGKIMVILDKKVDQNEKAYLLVTYMDDNGIIKVFIVNEQNIDQVFGPSRRLFISEPEVFQKSE
ncbi:TPA: hypothetical protein DEP90_01590 [Patescibacteria group bacterium]|nr:hypothetical protein [Patescibacteria group bacterium]